MNLITGATGFIGKKFVNALRQKGERFRVISRNKHADFETVICDFEKEEIPQSALESIDTVFHIAGLAHDSRDAIKIKDLYQKVNVNSTLRLANLAVKSGVKRFIFVSSVKAERCQNSRIFSDANGQSNQDGIYGNSKREAELKLLKIAKESDMHVVIIRPALVYGPEVKGNLKLMSTGIKKGWFPPLPETGNRLSMIHVDDLVRAIFLVAKEIRANGEIFIATDGIPYSSYEIYNTMRIVAGKSVPKWRVPKILFDIASLINPSIKYKLNKLFSNEFFSSTKLEELGFKAKKSLKNINETDF